MDVRSHLGFNLYSNLKRKKNNFKVISVPKLFENEVLHYILGLICQKLKKIQMTTFILAAILDLAAIWMIDDLEKWK